jgi:RNA recognition motif-containing protein
VQTTLYIGGLASHEDGGALARLFTPYGTVVYAKVMPYPDLIRRDGGFGVVEMRTRREARDAISGLHNIAFHGRTLNVRAATAAEQTAAGHPRMFGSMNIVENTDEDLS